MTEMEIALRDLVHTFRVEAQRLSTKTVSRSINTEAQALEVEYGLLKKAEGYRNCARALENLLNWYGVKELEHGGT